MALHDSPPHVITLLSLSVSRDAGGGTVNSFSTAQSSIPCSINTLSGSEREQFAQLGLVVTHSVAVLSSVLTVAVVRGMKATDSDGNSYHIEGIRKGRAYGNIPAFHYLDCRQIL